MLVCTTVALFLVAAAASFAVFCICQGVKLEREKEKNLSKDTLNGKVGPSNVVSHETPLIKLLSQ